MKNIVTAFILSFLLFNASAQSVKPFIRFGIIADIQYADCESRGSRFYRNSLQKLDDCIDYLNDHKVQFTINLGDVIDRDVADWDSVLIRLERFDNKVYNTTGNHDYYDVTDNRILYDKLKMPSEYYSFKKKNWVFILLNTNEISSYANSTDIEKEQEMAAMLQRIKSSGGMQGAEWNGGISAKQLEWLNRLLAKAEKSGDKVLVFSHHPLYPESAFTALNNIEILNVITNYSCVKAVFSGHHHAGSFAYYKNIPVVTVEGMIETESENAFGIIQLYDNKIVVEGTERMTSRELRFE